jgi:hypothetical protein
MTVTLPNSNKKISIEKLLAWLDKLPKEQKQVISQKLKEDDLKQLTQRFSNLADTVDAPEMSDEEVMAEIKAHRSGK